MSDRSPIAGAVPVGPPTGCTCRANLLEYPPPWCCRCQRTVLNPFSHHNTQHMIGVALVPEGSKENTRFDVDTGRGLPEGYGEGVAVRLIRRAGQSARSTLLADYGIRQRCRLGIRSRRCRIGKVVGRRRPERAYRFKKPRYRGGTGIDTDLCGTSSRRVGAEQVVATGKYRVV